MVNIRVVVPIEWNSEFKKELFQILIDQGYTWSSGDSLNKNQTNFQNVKFIAISPANNTVSYSTKTFMRDSVACHAGYNYLVDPCIQSVLRALKSVVALDSYIHKECFDSSTKLASLLQDHLDFFNSLMIL